MFNNMLDFVEQYYTFTLQQKHKAMELMSKVDFNEKINTLTPSLKSFAYNLTKDSEEAKDLYQETAFRAITNRDKFKAGTNLKAWLFTIMKNIFINNYRKKTKANTVVDTTENLFFINSSSVLVSNGAGTKIQMDELNGMIEGLEESIRVPFEMHYEGYKYQEIADQLALPLGTVKSRIFFARKELKSTIKHLYGDYSTIRSKLSA
jgi:RNA polymerase sigma-70 factor, ECF subfamily